MGAEDQKSFTAEGAENAKEKKSSTAKDAADAKYYKQEFEIAVSLSRISGPLARLYTTPGAVFAFFGF
ncbi:MAG: hypothetical protein OEP48_13440 [Betaproteobacteria bacterium]|nr:hypothetical protein [Betaproteobacteria bacterium]